MKKEPQGVSLGRLGGLSKALMIRRAGLVIPVTSECIWVTEAAVATLFIKANSTTLVFLIGNGSEYNKGDYARCIGR
jgi:hypothetical protein